MLSIPFIPYKQLCVYALLTLLTNGTKSNFVAMES